MKLRDYLEANKNNWPMLEISLRPLSYYDDLKNDGSGDYVVILGLRPKWFAYRVPLKDALNIAADINRAMIRSVEAGRRVNMHNGQDLTDQYPDTTITDDIDP